MLSQSLKVIPGYFTKSEAQKVKSFQKKNASKKEDHVLTIEIVDAYKFYKKSKGYSKIINKLGCPPLNTFMIHLIYTNIEDIPLVAEFRQNMIKIDQSKTITKKQEPGTILPIFIGKYPQQENQPYSPICQISFNRLIHYMAS